MLSSCTPPIIIFRLALIAMAHTLIVLDFETTGMSPDQGARPTEVAAVRIVNDTIVDRYQSLMNAGAHVPRFITELTGITNAMVRKAPGIDRVMRELHEFVGTHPVVAHNASFDRKFLEAEWLRLRLPLVSTVLCSLRVSRRLYPEVPSHRLGALVEYLALPHGGCYHRALADAEMTAHLWLRMTADIARHFRYREVPLDLMQHLQSITRNRVVTYLESYRERNGLTEFAGN